MAVLYRKYRPQTFGEVLNQKPIIQTLKNQVLGGSVAHAYLFTGSRGVGKTSVARILAKAVNCQEFQIPNSKFQKGEACGQCGICKAVEAGNFLDLVEIDAASNTGVDNIRELIEHVRFSPSQGKYKVFIIDEVHMLSKGAFNALLKTLEEPPKHAIFILATTEIQKVPATIISRTQRFDFKALSAGDLLSHLQEISKQEGLKFANEVLELIAQNAEGSVRDALSLLDKISTLGSEASLSDAEQLLGITDVAICRNLLDLIALGQANDIPDFFAGLEQKGVDYIIFNRDFLEFLRKVLVFKVTNGSLKSSVENLKDSADKFSISEIIFVIRLFLKSYKDLPSSPDPKIPLLLGALEGALKRPPDSSQQSASSKQLATKLTSQNIQTTQKPEVVEEMEKTLNTEPTQETSNNQAADTMSLEQVAEVWPKVINEVKPINSPLASMLRGAELLGVKNGKIILGVKFLFDKQNLENIKNAGLISATIEKFLGQKAAISAQVIKQAKAEPGDPSLVLTEALQVFGGELVE